MYYMATGAHDNEQKNKNQNKKKEKKEEEKRCYYEISESKLSLYTSHNREAHERREVFALHFDERIRGNLENVVKPFADASKLRDRDNPTMLYGIDVWTPNYHRKRLKLKFKCKWQRKVVYQFLASVLCPFAVRVTAKSLQKERKYIQ